MVVGICCATCSSLAASLLSGSSGLGSRNRYWRPYTMELMVRTGQRRKENKNHGLPLKHFVLCLLLLLRRYTWFPVLSENV